MALRLPRQPRRPVLLRPDRVLLTLKHPRIVQLAQQLSTLDREGGRQNSATRAAIGKLLQEARASLVQGDWLDFVTERTPFTMRSAERYIALHRFSEEQQVRYGDLAHLGASKLYLIASLPEAAQRELLSRKTHAVAGQRRKLSLEEMTYHELFQLVAGKAVEQSREAKAVKSFGRRIKALDKATGKLIEHAGAIDRDAAQGWRKALIEAA